MLSINRILLFTIALWAFPNAILCSQASEFSYKVLIGTTGSEKLIKVNGQWVNIEFSDLSNRNAVKALLGLRWQVLDRNSEGKIFVYGKKLNTYRTDIDGKTKVYDFVLTDWNISCPFEYFIEPKDWIPGDALEIGIKQLLDKDCFRYPIDTDWNKYCRNTKGGS